MKNDNLKYANRLPHSLAYPLLYSTYGASRNSTNRVFYNLVALYFENERNGGSAACFRA